MVFSPRYGFNPFEWWLRVCRLHPVLQAATFTRGADFYVSEKPPRLRQPLQHRLCFRKQPLGANATIAWHKQAQASCIAALHRPSRSAAGIAAAASVEQGESTGALRAVVAPA